MPHIERREIWLVIGISILVVAISTVPYVLGYLVEGPDLEFGGFLIDLDDSYSYLAKMQQGVWDGWRYRIPFTPEEHSGAYLYTFYLGLGKLSALLGLSVMQTYQLARLAGGLSLLVMAYIFVSIFLKDRDRRLVAYLLISFSSGLGWLVVLVGGSSTLGGISPIDFWWIEAYTFLAIFTFPHFSAALTLLLLFFTLALRYLETFRLPAFLLAIPTFLALCIVHPYNAFLVDGVLAAYWLLLLLKRKRLPRRESLPISIWAITPIPLLAYYYRALSSQPVFQSWAAQTVLPSPSILHLFLGYGVVSLMAIGGLVHVIRERDERGMLLVAWVASIIVLTYLPFSFQRKMVEGLHVPLCILATIGLFEYLLPGALGSDWLTRFARWRGYRRDGLRRLLVFSIIVATFPSNLCVLASASSLVLQHDAELFHRRHEVEAIDWLEAHTQRSDTVLASYEMGRLIPARAGNVVFMGHIIETVQVEHKRELAEAFFQADTSDDWRRALLMEYGVRYVFHGPEERQVGDLDPSTCEYLTPVYRNPEVTIYRVAT
ncbi:MAG TPA: hypothetical protein VMW58_14135 [Anaerolineae bacterium]|nr:hypothetical protein [Anaerolineae bacterium]